MFGFSGVGGWVLCRLTVFRLQYIGVIMVILGKCKRKWKLQGLWGLYRDYIGFI